MSDRIQRGLAADGAVRVVRASLGETWERAVAVHGLGPNAAVVCGECLVAAALMATWIDGDERITLQVQGESPRFSFVADVRADGGIRCRLTPASIAVGNTVKGLMLVIKSHADRELYRGVTEIRGQSIADALQAHLAASEQLEVILNVQGRVGWLAERLPDDGTRSALTFEEFYQRFEAVDYPTDVVVLSDRTVGWQCACSDAKVRSAVQGLGDQALSEMIEDGQPVEVTCHFCRVTRSLHVADLIGMRSDRA